MDEIQRIIVEVQNTARIRELTDELTKQAGLLMKVNAQLKEEGANVEQLSEGQQAVARNMVRNREELKQLQPGAPEYGMRRAMRAVAGARFAEQAIGAIATGQVGEAFAGGLTAAGEGVLVGGGDPRVAAAMMILGQIAQITARNWDKVIDLWAHRDAEQREAAQRETDRWKGVFQEILKGPQVGNQGVAAMIKTGMQAADTQRLAMELAAGAKRGELGFALNVAEKEKIEDIKNSWAAAGASFLGAAGAGDWGRGVRDAIEKVHTEAYKRMAAEIIEGVGKEDAEGIEARRKLAQFLDRRGKEMAPGVVPAGMERALKMGAEDFTEIEQKEAALRFQQLMFQITDIETRRRAADQGKRDQQRQEWLRGIDDLAIGGAKATEEQRKAFGDRRIELMQKLGDLENLGQEYQVAIQASNNPAYQDVMLGRLGKLEQMYEGLLRQLNRLNAAPVSRGLFNLQPFIW